MDKKIDVKMLVLKRWNQAQTGKLFDENIKQRGQYISFQSYHFIPSRENLHCSKLTNNFNPIKFWKAKRAQTLSEAFLAISIRCKA